MLLQGLWNNSKKLKAQKTLSRNHNHQFLYKEDNNFSLSQIKKDCSGSLEDFCREFRSGDDLSSVEVPGTCEFLKITELLATKWNEHM
jgi:hypothetical protein